MSDFVRYELDDGSEIFFESAEGSLVSMRGGQSDVVEGGDLRGRLRSVAAAAEEISASFREKMTPDEVTLEFGIKISGEVNWWFFAKNTGEATINVSLKWADPKVEQ